MRHMLASNILHADSGVLGFGSAGERAFGRRHFLELVSAFTTPGRICWLVKPVRALTASVHDGFRHFTTLTCHIWLMRLTLFGFRVVFVTLPIALAQSSTVNAAFRPFINNQLFSMNPWVVNLSCGLVYAVLVAYSIVYDARLYMALMNGNRNSDAKPI